MSEVHRSPKPIEVSPAADAAKEMRRLSRRGLFWAGAALLGGEAARRWLNSRRLEEGTVWPLRRALEFNESLWRDQFSTRRLVRTYPRRLAKMPRPNGLGWMQAAYESEWRLRVTGVVGEEFTFTLADIKALPRVEQVTRLCCIEGWSVIVHWTGTPFSALLDRIGEGMAMDRQFIRYVQLESSGDGYFVGLDVESALHPQTLLCYEMMGKPLTLEHGYPLRLVAPTKYGVKSLKQIGEIRLMQTRPDDYWAIRGYDWYAGL